MSTEKDRWIKGQALVGDPEAAHADAVCKVGLLVHGDPVKVDRAKTGDEIIEILNAFIRDRADLVEYGHDAAQAETLAYYKALSAAGPGDPWAASDAYQALASEVNVLHGLYPNLASAFDRFTRTLPHFTAMIREHARWEAKDEREQATPAPPDAPYEGAPPPPEEDRLAAKVRDTWLSVRWTPNARANIPPWSLTVASEKRAWRAVAQWVASELNSLRELYTEAVARLRRRRKTVRVAEFVGPREAAQMLDTIAADFQRAYEKHLTGAHAEAIAVLQEDTTEDALDE